MRESKEPRRIPELETRDQRPETALFSDSGVHCPRQDRCWIVSDLMIFRERQCGKISRRRERERGIFTAGLQVFPFRCVTSREADGFVTYQPLRSRPGQSVSVGVTHGQRNCSFTAVISAEHELPKLRAVRLPVTREGQIAKSLRLKVK